MTRRAVILGFLGAMLIAGAGYLNDSVLRLNFVVGNHFPISVFGMLILLVLIVNPVLHRLGPRWRLRGSELAVAVGLTLAGCGIPGSSMMRSFTPCLIMPIQYNEISPGWQQHKVLSYFPPQMLANGGKYDADLVDGYLHGRGGPRGEWISPIDGIPWRRWRGALTTWGVIVPLMGLCVICVCLIVHRQWSSHERLRYPIAEFANTLMEHEPGRGLPGIFRSRLFWIGAAAILAVRVVNGIHAWYDESIEIPLEFPQFGIILQKSKFLLDAPLWHKWPLFYVRLYPMVIAFAFFLAADVSLSLGLSTFVFVMWTAIVAETGVDFSGNEMRGALGVWFRAGAYGGLALLMLYTGRAYYWRVLKQGLTFRRQPGVESHAATALRVLLIGAAALVWFLWDALGLDPLIGLLAVASMLVLYLGIARMNAEAGLFFTQTYWQPAAVLIGLFGFAALGPRNLAIVGMLCAVLTYDPRECLMPFIVNGLRICDRAGISPRRIGWGMAGIYALGFAVAVPVVLWANYNYGVNRDDTWATDAVPKAPVEMVDHTVQQFEGPADIERAERLGTWERIGAARPHRRFLWGFGVGMGLVVLFSVMRLRLPWWGLHPIMFLTGGTWAMDVFGHSFLLGWLIKAAVTRFGTSRAYARAKQLMVGVIVGDVLGGILFMAVSAASYFISDTDPKRYLILPP